METNSKYYPAPKDVRITTKKVRRKHYSEFSKARIVILMKMGKWRYAGTMSKVSQQHRLAGIEGDYILTISEDAWTRFNKKQRTALIDHELMHMSKKKSKNGTMFTLRDHDVEEFLEIVRRYGEWTPSLSAMRKALAHGK